MTKPNLKLAETPQCDDPLRAELRAAIERRIKADAAVEAARSKLAHADERITASTAALEVATSEVAKVKARAIAAAAGSARDMGAVLRAARAAQTDAADVVEIAQGVRDAIAAELPDVEAAAAWAANDVIVCANALLAPEAARLLAETRELRLRLAFNEARIAEVFRDRGGPAFAETLNAMIARDKRDAPLAAIKEEASHFLGMIVGGTIEEQRKITARIAEWWQAREATWTDADAPMPEL